MLLARRYYMTQFRNATEKGGLNPFQCRWLYSADSMVHSAACATQKAKEMEGGNSPYTTASLKQKSSN
jgi:hypothetical protein